MERVTLRRTGAALLGCLLPVAGLTACGPPSADPTARAYLAAWSRDDLAGAARLTDDPTAAAAALKESADGLARPAVRTELGDVSTHSDTATAAFVVHVAVPGLTTWTYRGKLQLHRDDDRWRVTWSPTDIHPALTPTTHLGVIR